jgi:hypothetical protein
MKKVIIIIAIGFSFLSTYASNDMSEEYLNQYICFTNIRGRIIEGNKYVTEIKVVNKGDQPNMEDFGLQGQAFKDDGMGYDLVAKDGIFTSHELNTLSNNFDGNLNIMNYVIGPGYNFGIDPNADPNILEITCRMVKIPCSSGPTCANCYFGGSFCIEFHDCSITIGL